MGCRPRQGIREPPPESVGRDVITSAWGNSLPNALRKDLAKDTSTLDDTAWLHDNHVLALLHRAFFRAMEEECDVPSFTFLAPQAAALITPDVRSDDELQDIAYSVFSDGAFDFISFDATLILLNSPGAGFQNTQRRCIRAHLHVAQGDPKFNGARRVVQR